MIDPVDNFEIPDEWIALTQVSLNELEEQVSKGLVVVLSNGSVGYFDNLRILHFEKIIERANIEAVIHFIRILTLVIIIIEKPIRKNFMYDLVKK